MSTPFRLLLPRPLHAQMLAHALVELPNECCGLLAGKVGADGTAEVERCYPMVNVLASPVAYEWEPSVHFAALREMRTLKLDMVAIYHSHPTSDPIPSRTDRERYAEAQPLLGDVLHFIIGRPGATPDVRGWWLSGDTHSEADWELS